MHTNTTYVILIAELINCRCDAKPQPQPGIVVDCCHFVIIIIFCHFTSTLPCGRSSLCISAICNRQHINIFSPRGVSHVCVHSTRANYAYLHSVFIVPSLGYDEHVLRSNNSSQTINRERAKRVPKTYHDACGTQYVVYTYPKYAYLYA